MPVVGNHYWLEVHCLQLQQPHGRHRQNLPQQWHIAGTFGAASLLDKNFGSMEDILVYFRLARAVATDRVYVDPRAGHIARQNRLICLSAVQVVMI